MTAHNAKLNLSFTKINIIIIPIVQQSTVVYHSIILLFRAFSFLCAVIGFDDIADVNRRSVFTTIWKACTRLSVWKFCLTSICLMTTMVLVLDLSNRSFVRTVIEFYYALVPLEGRFRHCNSMSVRPSVRPVVPAFNSRMKSSMRLNVDGICNR